MQLFVMNPLSVRCMHPGYVGDGMCPNASIVGNMSCFCRILEIRFLSASQFQAALKSITDFFYFSVYTT